MAKRRMTPAKRLAKLGMHLAAALQKKRKQHEEILLDAFEKGWPIDVQISVEPPKEYIQALELQAARAAELAFLDGLTVDQRLKLAGEMGERGYGPMEEGQDPLEWLQERISGTVETYRVETARLDAQIQVKIAERAAAADDHESFVDPEVELAISDVPNADVTPVDLALQVMNEIAEDREVFVPFSQVDGALDNEPETVVTVSDEDAVVGSITFDAPHTPGSPALDIECPEGQAAVLRGSDAGDEYWDCVSTAEPND